MPKAKYYMKNENQKFINSDFYLSAFCLAKGIRLIDIDRANPRRLLFIFDDKKNRQNLIEDFLYGRTKIEPKSFVSAIKELKALIYSNEK